MKKYIYRVAKKFTLSGVKSEEMGIFEDPEPKSGSHFSKGDTYVDYESLEKDVEITELTKKLLNRDFLTLITQIEI